MAHTLISADNTWALWAIIIGWAAVSIWLEQKYKWASKISGAIIALLGTLILSNIGVIPQEYSCDLCSRKWNLHILRRCYYCRQRSYGNRSHSFIQQIFNDHNDHSSHNNIYAELLRIIAWIPGYRFLLYLFIPDGNRRTCFHSSYYTAGACSVTLLCNHRCSKSACHHCLW